MRSDVRRALLPIFAALVLLSASCGQKPPLVFPPPATQKELIKALAARAASFTADGRLRLSGFSAGFAECRIMVDPKAGMRIDVFSPFMTPLATLIVARDRGEYLNQQEGVLVRGKASEILSRMFDLSVDPSPLPWILGGGIPPCENGWASVAPEPDEPRRALVLSGKDGEGRSWRAVFEDENYRLTRFIGFQDDNGDKKKVIIECADHLEGVLPIPRKITLRSSGAERALVLKLYGVQPGKGPRAEDLTIKNVPGVEELEL